MDKGREGHWNNKNITQTGVKMAIFRLKLIRRNISVSSTSKISAKKKKKWIPSSYESGFQGKASIFFAL